jgi:hypothetical protein
VLLSYEFKSSVSKSHEGEGFFAEDGQGNTKATPVCHCMKLHELVTPYISQITSFSLSLRIKEYFYLRTNFKVIRWLACSGVSRKQ